MVGTTFSVQGTSGLRSVIGLESRAADELGHLLGPLSLDKLVPAVQLLLLSTTRP